MKSRKHIIELAFSRFFFFAEAMRYLEGRRRIEAGRKICSELCPHLLRYY